MTGCDMLLFLVVTVQIKIQWIVWCTSNHVNNSTLIFITVQLNMIKKLHVLCFLNLFDSTKNCEIMLNNLFILTFRGHVVFIQHTVKVYKHLACFMMQQATHGT
jgi:hypothetical protein